jgi:hypothetical protein
MGSNEGVRLQLSQVEIKQSSGRETPLTSFGETFKAGMATTANVVGNAAATAGYAIPGAAVVSAAIHGAGAVRDSSGGLSATAPGSSGLVASGGNMGLGGTMGGYGGAGGIAGGGAYGGGYMDAVAGRAAAGDPSSQMMMATQQMQEMNQTFNLQYLQLQEKMQGENRQFTALSNVMKTKHDTAKNALSNLK